MPRNTCLLLGLVLAFAPLVLMSRTDAPTSSDLSIARGGNPGLGKASVQCDREFGSYSACTFANDDCQQCLKDNGDGTFSPYMADKLDRDAPKNGQGYQNGNGHQDCGNTFFGTCSEDPTSPTGFKCNGEETFNKCITYISTVMPQAPPLFP